MSNQSSSVIL